MSESTSWPKPDGRLNETVPSAVAQRLLESVVAIGNHHAELVDRRRAFLTVLLEEIGADAGFWTWGYGKPTDVSITPVAVIDLGFTDAQRAVVMQWGFDQDAFRGFYRRIFLEMQGVTRSRSLLLADFNEDERKGLPVMRSYMEQGGWGSWLHNARYCPQNTWSSLFVLRISDREEFGPREAAILELAVTSVSWLHAIAEESLPSETVQGLTQRQRTVMLMLLDGSPRKVIAQQLGISEDTVGEHLKSIYTHFQVTSSIELAALFLRNR